MTINTFCQVTNKFKCQARTAVILTVTHTSLFSRACVVGESGVTGHCGRITASTKDEANLLECCRLCVLDGWAATSDSSVRRKDTEFDEQVILFSPQGVDVSRGNQFRGLHRYH